MSNRNYKRTFITLQEDEKEFINKKCIGKCVIETRNNKGKVMISSQGLPKNKTYRVTFINVNNGNSIGVPIGVINTLNFSKIDFRTEFLPDNLGNSNIKIEDFNVVALIDEDSDKIISPLVGYVDKHINWKDTFSYYKKDEKQSLEKVEKIKEEREPIENFKEVKNIEKIIDEDEIVNEEYEEEEKIEELHLNEIEEVDGNFQQVNSVQEDLIMEKVKEINEVNKILDGKLDNHCESESKNLIVDENFEEKNIFPKPEFLSKQKVEEVEEVEEVEKKEAKSNEDINKSKEERGKSSENPSYKAFKEMINKFKDEISALKEVEKTEKVEEKIEEPQNLDIAYIVKNNPKMQPFDEENKKIKWYRISPFELSIVGKDTWKLINNAFVFSSYKKYKHLMLGIFNQNGWEKYVVAVPCRYDKRFISKQEFKGFDEFKKCLKSDSEENPYGYRFLYVD